VTGWGYRLRGEERPVDQFLLLLLPLVALYFLIIRPTQTRRRRQSELTASLQPGQEIITHSGLRGTVVGVADDVVEVSIAPGVVTRWSSWGIGGVVPAAEPPSGGDAPPEGPGSSA
jgi:preprotein translocase subunit YajC